MLKFKFGVVVGITINIKVWVGVLEKSKCLKNLFLKKMINKHTKCVK